MLQPRARRPRDSCKPALSVAEGMPALRGWAQLGPELRRHFGALAGLFHGDGIEEGHHAAQLLADLLQLLLLFFFAGGVKPFPASLILGDPLFGETSILNLAQ